MKRFFSLCLKMSGPVMKITVPVFLLAVLVFPALLLSAESGSGQSGADNGSPVVSGIGYPPIKAENAVQARLMARRAAVIDAYRNALAGAGSSNNDEQTFYTGLSGFVRGLTIEREEYLEDGGVRILARVPGRNAAVTSRTPREVVTEKGLGGPSSVPLNEWYRIIERSVRFE